MVEGMKLLRRIVAQTAMQPYIAAEHAPGDKVKTDADWLAYCRATGGTIYHPSCTAMIGKVLDHRLRLKDLGGLRVVDASIMPAVVSGNTNAAVIAVAEKAADLIGADARL